MIGHRGACGYRPEHTLAAYKLAIDMGADFIEPDVVSTKDGVLVARHESELGCTTDVATRPRFADRRTTKEIGGEPITGWFVQDFTLAELKLLRARERFPELRSANTAFDCLYEIPTLREVVDLAAFYGAGVCPETKDPAYHDRIGLPLEEPLVRTLHVHGYRSRSAAVFIQSFDAAHLRRIGELTAVPLVRLLDDGRPTPAQLAKIAGYAAGVSLSKRLIATRDRSTGRLRPTATVEEAHAAGLAAHAWTFRLEDDFLLDDLAAAYSLGVDAVVCDQPDIAVAVRSSTGARRLQNRAGIAASARS